VARAVLLAAVPPILLESATNPEGLPIEVFDEAPLKTYRVTVDGDVGRVEVPLAHAGQGGHDRGVDAVSKGCPV